MRVLLTALDSKFIHSNLALRYLNKIAEQSSWDVVFHERTINDDVDLILNELIQFHPDLLVFSCYIWNIEYVRQLSEAVRMVLPQTMILCGGPEVAYDAENFLQEVPADGVMVGEGEVIFPEVLNALEASHHQNSDHFLTESLREIPGLMLRLDDGSIRLTAPARLADMSEVPFPYDKEDLGRLEHRIVYYEGQRGCPYGCTYCLSSIDRTLRHKPVEMVKRELGVLMDAKVPLVKLVDRTFNIKEDWAFDILSFLLSESIQRGGHTSFHFEVGAATLSDRLIQTLNQAPPGLFQIEAGIQTTDPWVLRLINRRDDPVQLRDALNRIIEAGNVHVHTDLIAGLPGDTLETFRNSFNDCIKMRPQMLQVGFLKVLKGTPLWHSASQYDIRFRPWPPYEVLGTDRMSYEDLRIIKLIEQVTDKYYNSGKFACCMKYLLSIFDEPWELFIIIAELLLKYQKHISAVSFEDYYRALNDLRETLTPEQSAVLADLLRFDYILGNRKGNFPEWLKSQKYNSSRGRILFSDRDNFQLKGSVEGFRIKVLRFWQSGEIIAGESLIFYSLAYPDLIEVRHISGTDYTPA